MRRRVSCAQPRWECVSRVSHRSPCRRGGITWPVPDGLDDAAWERPLFSLPCMRARDRRRTGLDCTPNCTVPVSPCFCCGRNRRATGCFSHAGQILQPTRLRLGDRLRRTRPDWPAHSRCAQSFASQPFGPSSSQILDRSWLMKWLGPIFQPCT